MLNRKKTKFLYHFAIVLAVTLLTIPTKGKDLSNENEGMSLKVQVNEENQIVLNWDIVEDANYYKVFRAEVTSGEDSTNENAKYFEMGISEVNQFMHNFLGIDGENNEVSTSSSFLYYITAIDAFEKEIERSEVVKLSLPVIPEEILN